MTLKRRNFFCHTCNQYAEFVLVQLQPDTYAKWHCCHCNPLLLEATIYDYYEIKESV